MIVVATRNGGQEENSRFLALLSPGLCRASEAWGRWSYEHASCIANRLKAEFKIMHVVAEDVFGSKSRGSSLDNSGGLALAAANRKIIATNVGLAESFLSRSPPLHD